jgi:hypothetical protein
VDWRAAGVGRIELERIRLEAFNLFNRRISRRQTETELGRVRDDHVHHDARQLQIRAKFLW